MVKALFTKNDVTGKCNAKHCTDKTLCHFELDTLKPYAYKQCVIHYCFRSFKQIKRNMCNITCIANKTKLMQSIQQEVYVKCWNFLLLETKIKHQYFYLQKLIKIIQYKAFISFHYEAETCAKSNVGTFVKYTRNFVSKNSISIYYVSWLFRYN